MMAADMIKSCLDSVRHISEHIEDALVYLDAGCTEAFQFLGAFSLLLELGACNVCSLENNSSLVADWTSNFNNAKKVVVITARLLSDSHRYILRCLSTHRTVKSCAIFTSVSEAKPSLGDQSVILIFVVGGINGHEVLEVLEALSQSGRADIELIIGGTTLLTPDNMFDLLLGSSSYF